MRSGEAIAVIDPDLARRVAMVEGLTAQGYRAFGIGGCDRLSADKRPAALLVVHVASRAELDRCMLAMRSEQHFVALPFIVMATPDAGVGAVDAFAAGADDFVIHDVSAAELAARIEARVSRQRTVAKLSRDRVQTEVVLELTRALSSTLDLREILFLVVKRIAEVVHVDRVSIVLGGLDEDTGYVIAASDDQKLRDLPIDLTKYPEIQRVLDTGQSLVVDDAHAHPLLSLAQATVPSRFRSLVLMPILFEDRAMGVLFLRFEQERAIDAEDDFLLRAIANATGIALRNASLLHTLRDQSRRNKTAHVEAEKQLRALQRYVDFFDSMADGILVVMLSGQVLFCNPAACVILGRSEQELSEIRLEDMLTPDGKKRFRSITESFSQGMFPHGVDLPIRTGDGRRRVLAVSFSSVLREHNGVIVSLRDVTEDRAMARELTKTKEFLQRVIDSSVDAIVSADMAGNILLFNPAAERTYGYSYDEVVGMNVRALYPDGEARQVMRLIHSDEFGASGTLQGYETELLGKGGTRIPVVLSAALIVHRGRPIGSVGVFKDLRARLQIEERLRKTQRELAERDQKAFIAELAGATAHELNQPLTTVMGYAGMLEKALAGDQRLARALSAIVRETERMAEIVRKIGKLTKYESKAYVGDTKIIDIERSIDSEPPATGM